MGLPSDVEKILFHPFYTVKDLSGNMFFYDFFFCIILVMPRILRRPSLWLLLFIFVY